MRRPQLPWAHVPQLHARPGAARASPAARTPAAPAAPARDGGGGGGPAGGARPSAEYGCEGGTARTGGGSCAAAAGGGAAAAARGLGSDTEALLQRRSRAKGDRAFRSAAAAVSRAAAHPPYGPPSARRPAEIRVKRGRGGRPVPQRVAAARAPALCSRPRPLIGSAPGTAGTAITAGQSRESQRRICRGC